MSSHFHFRQAKCCVFFWYHADFLCRYDLEDAFGKYGPVKNVWVARRPPGFGFVEMEARQDAEEAVGKTIAEEMVVMQFCHVYIQCSQVRLLDGTRVAGSRIRVRFLGIKSCSLLYCFLKVVTSKLCALFRSK